MTKPEDQKTVHKGGAPARPVWLFWLIPMAGLVALVWFILRGDRSVDEVPAAPAIETEPSIAQ